MGKIRIKILGSPENEAKEKQKTQLKKEGKKARLEAIAKKTTKAPGLKGGERVVSMGPSEEELASLPTPLPEEEVAEKVSEVEEKAKAVRPPKVRGKKYQKAAKLVDKNRLYPLGEALELVKKTSLSRFDGAVEVHINTLEKGLAGQVQLPHGTGKETRVAIVDPSTSSGQVEALLKKIESGVIDFDVLVATPMAMPLLAKVAKILGPKGLMPNPKAGTVTEEPEKMVEKLKSGGIRFKTETQAPLIHLVIGKVSFPEKNLEENLRAVIFAIGVSKIKKLILSSTMGPAVKVDLTTV